MDMDCMKAFIVICDSGRLSKAAEQLFVSKQALSALVKKMENELGTSLLEREKTGMKLTSAGECFYEYAKIPVTPPTTPMTIIRPIIFTEDHLLLLIR